MHPHVAIQDNSFSLSRLYITTVSESLFVAEVESVSSLNSLFVIKGPAPLTYIHCIEGLS